LNDDPQACRRIRALAERDPRRAVILARRGLVALPADDSIARAWPVYTLGWALLWWERFDEARPHLHAARELFAAHGRRLDVLRCDYALLLADLFQHARPDLEQDLAALAAQFEQAGALQDAARARLYQAILFDILGRPHDAGALLEQIAPVVADGQPIDQARWLYIRGAVAISHGNYTQAESLLAQAEQSFAGLHNPLERAKCWFQQAWAALRQEKLDLALAGYRRAEQIFARLDLPVRLALCSKGIGLLLTRMGRYDDALYSLLRALRAFTALQRTSDTGTCHLNLGNIYYYTGQWDIALAYYRRAEDLYLSSDVLGERLFVQRNRAMVYRAQGRFDEARALFAMVETEAQIIGDHSLIADIWDDRAMLLDSEGRHAEAITQYQRAYDQFIRLGNQSRAAEAAMKQGWLALKHGERDVAKDLFQLAAPLLVRHPHERWQTDYGLARCAEARGDVETALRHYWNASVTVAELRRRLASEAASSSLYAQAAQLYTDSLRLALASGALADLLVLSEWQRALVMMRALTMRSAAPSADYARAIETCRLQIAGLLSESMAMSDVDAQALDAALADYSDLLLRARHSTSTPPDTSDNITEVILDLTELRARLDGLYGTDWTTLVYILSGDNTLLIGVVTSHEVRLTQRPYDGRFQRLIQHATQPEYQLYTYRDLPYFEGRATQPWAGLGALADQLLPEEVRDRLHPNHRLLIIPAGPLHTLPWGALRLGEHWLAEQAIVHLMPSLTILQSLIARRRPTSGDALLIGCRAFGARAAELPAVGDELTSVVQRWPGMCLRLDDAQATRAALLERSARGDLVHYGLLHIASHAQLLPHRGVAAHIKLWDNDLWLSEIAELHLNDALVMLSACDGALADMLPGEEILSLSWAFLAAGAGGVIASLWEVPDQAARQFIDIFYDALRQHNDPGLALAQAQRTLIVRHRLTAEPLAEPLCWGNFVLTGGCHMR
jgi:tetratricopeptide (TPR) repeat protein